MDFSSNSTPRQLIPAGMHTAILYSVVDLGTQEVKMQGQPAKYKRKVRFTWELPDEKMEDGRPFSSSREYTQSSHEKATIVKDMKAWTGDLVTNGFNPKSLLGKACNLTIAHTAKEDETYANIMGIAPLKKGEQVPPITNPLVFFDMDAFDLETFNALPEFLQTKIKASPEYVEAINRMNGAYSQPEPVLSPSQAAAAKAVNKLDDEIPF